MINFNKNKLINQTLDKYYDTFSHMLDTCDYVPQKYNDKIGKYIFKNMKKSFKIIDKEDKKFQKEFNKKVKENELKLHPKKENKFIMFLSKIFKKKKVNASKELNADSN